MPTATEVAQDFKDEDDVQDTTNGDVEDTTNADDNADDSTADDQNADADNNDIQDDKNTSQNDDEGFFADDEESEDASTEPELPAPPANFTAEEKYIIDNLPLISVRVIMADDSIKTMQVRSAADLPRDMKGIATPYEDKQFDLANAAQETRARELQAYYRQHQNTVQAQEFEKKENQAIRDDIAELQREGEIPKFKAQPGTRAFNNDPAAKKVQEVIEFMNERNAKYLEKSNAGGAYRHIGFAEAYELMNRGESKVDKNSSTRKEAARQLTSRQGSSNTKNTKAPVSGRTIAEVAREFEDFE